MDEQRGTSDCAPNPGTQAAIEAGCTCPWMDNRNGVVLNESGQRTYWYSSDCPVHGIPQEQEADECPQ